MIKLMPRYLKTVYLELFFCIVVLSVSYCQFFKRFDSECTKNNTIEVNNNLNVAAISKLSLLLIFLLT